MVRKNRAAAMEALVQRCRSDADVPLRLDTLHGEAVHLKLNRLLPLEPRRGENQNSISVTSHGSKRPIRCCQELEKCKVTVHFTSDSVSVSLAGSPVNSQRAVKVERCRRQTAGSPPLLTATALSSTPLCFVFQLTGQRERRQCAGSRAQADTFFWRPSSLSIPPLTIVLCLPFPFLSLPFSSVLGL